MIPQTKKYHIVTVHYGESLPTKTLVEQLLHSQRLPDRIIVVDHGPASLPDFWGDKRVAIIRPARNAGYAGGVNFGLGFLLGQRTSRSDIVILLNNDSEVSPDTVEKVIAWWQTNPAPAIAGIKLGQVNLVTGRTTIDSKLSASTADPPKWWAASRFHLTYLHGSFLSAPLNTFLTLQGLPNHFFMYWEDVLFSLRARQMGIPLKVISGLPVTHDDAPPSQSDSDHLYYLVRNGAMFLQSNSPRPWRWLWRLLNLLRLIYHNLQPASPSVRTIRQALRDAVLHRTGQRP
ncbi:MAG: glycosyltransferase [Patescibacteria group bacterium]